MPNSHPIDPAKLRFTVGALTSVLAQRDYEAFCGFARASRLTPTDVDRVVREYGRCLVPFSGPAFEAVDVVPISDCVPQRWSVVVHLWSKEEGRSDLSLEITMQDSSTETYPVEIDDLHVL